MSLRSPSRPATARRGSARDMSQPSQRLAAEASLLKPKPGSGPAAEGTAGSLLTLHGSEKLTKSAVRFDDAKQEAAKESYKKQKQAWESPPDTPQLSRTPIISPKTHQSGRKKVQEFLYPEHLMELKQRFQDLPSYTKGKLNLDGFIEFFRSLPELKGKSNAEIKVFFDKIDCYSKGEIDWDEFCTYMYLELYEKEDAQSKAKEVVFSLPSVPIQGPHKDSICRILNLQDGPLVTCSQDGVVCFWTNDMKPKRVRKTESGILGKPKWISDMSLATAHGKIIMTTGDNEVQFYEMINFEPYCQITNLDCTPLKLDFWSNPENKNDCILLVGDEQGCVTVLSIPHIPEAFKIMKMGPKKNGIPTFPIDGFIRGESVAGVKLFKWKLHSNWVSHIQYIGELRLFASSSNDSKASLVMGTPSGSTPVDAILHGQRHSRSYSIRSSLPANQMGSLSIRGVTKTIIPAKTRMSGDQKIFSVNKGITTFDYCTLNNILVTGGMDQVIRIWNPFVTAKPIGSLYGQGSPVFCVRIDSTNNRIYSIGNDNTLKVWDSIEQTCLSTVTSATHKVYQTVEALHFNIIQQYLVIATEQIHVIQLSLLGGLPKPDMVHTHRLPVSAMSYSCNFGLVITACEESVIKVWDIITGECVFEFASVHDNSRITAIDLDSSGRRLVTAGENGEIKLWNFNNGHCLLTLDKGNDAEVADVKFVSVNQIRYIVAVGWDRKLNVFSDLLDSAAVQSSIFPIEGWDKSSTCVHHEDITSITFCLPTTLATASFDGEIILWSMTSGHMIQRLQVSTTQNYLRSVSIDEGDYAIHRLLYLETRRSRTSASLVASGPAGYVHFWNIHDTKKPMGLFQASSHKCITDMVVDTANTQLITGDIEGFVCRWDIRLFCKDKTSLTRPKCIIKWRAHTSIINSLSFIEEWSLLVTASSDCSVRVWTQEGHYIGTFGQKQFWDIGNTATYQHPLAPKDVLFDPLTIPVIGDDEQKVQEENVIESIGMRLKVTDIEDPSNQSSMGNEDENMLAQYGLSFNVPSMEEPEVEYVGKRLRHLRSNSAKSSTGYRPLPGSYGSLLYQELQEEPSFNAVGSLSTRTLK